MIHVRKKDERGHFDFGWLNTYHTFSFGDYYDPDFMGFRSLRVINEDRVQPGQGFGTHPHKEMEIITYLMQGELAHKDSMGNGSVIRPGEIQYMSAGTGVTHSEFNNSKSEQVHLYQIWILPNEKGAAPRYDQKMINPSERDGKLKLLVSNDGKNGSIAIRQDAELFSSVLKENGTLEYKIKPERHAWVQAVNGELELNGTRIGAGDGAAISNERLLKIRSLGHTEFLLFDLN